MTSKRNRSRTRLAPCARLVIAGEGDPGQLVIARYDASGGLDPSFGSGGIATTDFRPGNASLSYASDLLIQPDGRLVVVGTRVAAVAGETDVVLARYEPDGSPDPSFGSGGVVNTSFGSFFGSVDAALQPDGRIVVVTDAANAGGVGLVRYRPDGSLDPTFGSGGTTTSTALQTPQALALQADGKLVVAGGGLPDAGRSQFGLARFNADGGLDPTFGSGGVAATTFEDANPSPYVVAVSADPSGGLVAMGSLYYLQTLHGFAYRSELGLARFGANGSLDPSFGTGGTVLTSDFGTASLPIDAGARLIAAGRKGRIVVAGRTQNDRWLLAAYSANGKRDQSFGVDGTVPLARSSGLLIDPRGRIVTVGLTGLVSRYTADGAPDRRFGHDGVAPGLIEHASGGVREPSGKIVIAGSSGRRIEVARYLPSGRPDRTFGKGGRVVIHSKRGAFRAKGIVAERNGRIVVAGRRLVVGLGPNGHLAKSFGHRGFVSVPVGPAARRFGAMSSRVDGILRTRDGKLVVFGERWERGGNYGRVALFRFNASGAPDRSFGHRGRLVVLKPANVKLSALTSSGSQWGAVERNGKIVLGVDALQAAHVAVIRLNRNGSPDRSFGGNGRAVTPVPGSTAALTVAPSGRILAAGRERSADGVDRLLIAGFVG